jgi:hypothetical protein
MKTFKTAQQAENEMLTQELKAYAAQIMIQRGIKELTPELLGEVLKSSLKNMDKAACKFMDSGVVQRQFAKAVYDDIRAA